MRNFSIGQVKIKAGQTKDVRIKISETYTGDTIACPIRVIRADVDGPVVFVSAAIHGDEINGTGVIHHLMFDQGLKLKCGTLLLIPVVNVFGFESNERYLPDRRDLNRSFPGSESGSLASRIAKTFMDEVVNKCDYGIDLHTAASQRTNYPNVRGDLTSPEVRKIANDFGCELVVDGKGPVGSFRREACKSGCATILLEAGEPLKVEPTILKIGTQGVRNVLIGLEMIAGTPIQPPYQTRINKTTWVRAELGGILDFHVSPGEIIESGQMIATNYGIMGNEQNIITSPIDGIVLGMTTTPAVKPGEPVCHIAKPTRKMSHIRKALSAAPVSNIYRKAKRDLATNMSITVADDNDSDAR